MAQYNNVSVVKKANIYFDGKVTSRTVKFDNGEIKTLGIMMPGEYQFGTEKAELMEILAGDVEVKLPDSDKWITIKGGESFNVPANSKFDIKVLHIADYCCSYID
jgi:uncharacterized protein YaiE (UPF0345 family)